MPDLFQGRPYPSQEQNAIDIVMQFAINKLGFKLDNVILFGWSIGGYTVTWAAMNYPEVKGIVMNTFILSMLYTLFCRLWFNYLQTTLHCLYNNPVYIVLYESKKAVWFPESDQFIERFIT